MRRRLRSAPVARRATRLPCCISRTGCRAPSRSHGNDQRATFGRRAPAALGKWRTRRPGRPAEPQRFQGKGHSAATNTRAVCGGLPLSRLWLGGYQRLDCIAPFPLWRGNQHSCQRKRNERAYDRADMAEPDDIASDPLPLPSLDQSFYKNPRNIGKRSSRYSSPVRLMLSDGALASKVEPSGESEISDISSSSGPSSGSARSSDR